MNKVAGTSANVVIDASDILAEQAHTDKLGADEHKQHGEEHEHPFCRPLAKELAGWGITCNVVAPGFVATDMTGKLPEQVLSAAQEAIPLKRMGSPEEIAAVCTFLASDGAGYITGAVIPVDGGLNM